MPWASPRPSRGCALRERRPAARVSALRARSFPRRARLTLHRRRRWPPGLSAFGEPARATLARASLRSRPRPAAARALRLFEPPGPATRCASRGAATCRSDQPADLLVPVVVRPSHASCHGALTDQGPASLSAAPVLCSPSAALRMRPVGSPLTPRFSPAAGARYGERLRGTMELTPPHLVSPAGSPRPAPDLRARCARDAKPKFHRS
jgi:hypothetical protein